MSGYRQHGFDPYAYEQPGEPLKPYDKLQWTGVALGSLGIVLSLVDLAATFGWLPERFDVPTPITFPLLILGAVLVNSRRGPSTQVGREQLDRNRRTLIITLAICAFVLGVALFVEFGQ